ncbi:hypothetical protein JW711_03550 [Candidatus Woesearchaeota archaeon]|nr:hypothetical protein [Candidatus Woesearchaeota archaeon]
MAYTWDQYTKEEQDEWEEMNRKALESYRGYEPKSDSITPTHHIHEAIRPTSFDPEHLMRFNLLHPADKKIKAPTSLLKKSLDYLVNIYRRL